MAVVIRQASPDDAPGIVAVWQQIVAERVHSAVIRPWSVEQQSRYIASLSPREAFHVAVDGFVVGFQSLDLWSPILDSMAHVGQVGTFLLPEWRGRGAGRALWERTEAFARSAGYRKLLIQVRAGNTAAQAFYARLEFVTCGRLGQQVMIDGQPEDEVLMERFL